MEFGALSNAVTAGGKRRRLAGVIVCCLPSANRGPYRPAFHAEAPVGGLIGSGLTKADWPLAKARANAAQAVTSFRLSDLQAFFLSAPCLRLRLCRARWPAQQR